MDIIIGILGLYFYIVMVIERRKWQPAPVFLPGESHGQWSLVGYSPWGCRLDFIRMYAHIIWEGAEPVSEDGVGAHPSRMRGWRLRLYLALQRALLIPLTAQGLGTRETIPQQKLPSSRTTQWGVSDRHFSENHSGKHSQRSTGQEKSHSASSSYLAWDKSCQYKQDGHAVFTVHKGNDHPGIEGRMGKYF